MAAINSLLFLLTTLSPLSEYADFTTTPSVDTEWISGESSALAPRCPAGEVFANCTAHCQKNCTNYDRPIACPLICVNGCVCPIGKIRGPKKQCIVPDQCREGRKCPVGEVYSYCGATCQRNCSNKDQDIICPLICTPGCICEKGKIRGPNNRCINPEQCRGKYCPAGEIFEECKAHCQKNCTNKDQEVECPRICNSGCICPAGKVRGPDNRCIVPEKCSKRDECPAGERYDQCGAACQKNCTNYDRIVICPRICISGCVCPEGQVRGADKRCIIPEKCSWNNEVEQRQDGPSPQCSWNEVFKNCSSYCPDSCRNRNTPDRKCKTICIPGCECKKGMVWSPEGRCVDPKSCPSDHTPAGCGKKERFLKCGSACPDDCSNFFEENRPCTSQCVMGCFCEDGYVRGPRGDCILTTDCPWNPKSYLFMGYPSSTRTDRKFSESSESSEERSVHFALQPEGRKPCPHTVCRTGCHIEYNATPCPRCVCDDVPERKPCPQLLCRPGYHLDTTVKPCPRCVRDNVLQSTPEECTEEEIFLRCGTACPDDCSNFSQENRACTQQCVTGCFCTSGHVRGPEGNCILPTDCPFESEKPCPQLLCRPGYHLDTTVKPCPRCVRDNVLQRTDRKFSESSESSEERSVRFALQPEARKPCPHTVCRTGCHLEYNARPCPRCVCDDVPESTHEECTEEEIFLRCGTACPDDCSNFSQENRACTQQCVTGCFCTSGHVRGPEGNCILPTDCPSESEKPCPQIRCRPGYHLDTTVKPCPRCVRDNVLQSIPCPKIQCRTGCHLDNNARPCPRCVCDDVPENKTCGKNEIWTDCVIPCNDCVIQGRCQFLVCNPGCDCRRNYYRDSTGKCIPKHVCPKIDRPCPLINCKRGCQLDNEAKPCPRCRCDKELEEVEDNVEETEEDNSFLMRRIFSESEEDITADKNSNRQF